MEKVAKFVKFEIGPLLKGWGAGIGRTCNFIFPKVVRYIGLGGWIYPLSLTLGGLVGYIPSPPGSDTSI